MTDPSLPDAILSHVITSPTCSEISNMGPEELLELQELLVFEFNPEQLTAYVERLHILSVSAQTRRAAQRDEGEALGAEKRKTKAKVKSNVSLALEMLKQIQG